MKVRKLISLEDYFWNDLADSVPGYVIHDKIRYMIGYFKEHPEIKKEYDEAMERIKKDYDMMKG